MTCAICERNPATMGVLCSDCSLELGVTPSISPEQIVSHAAGATAAALIDAWGRPHRLDPNTTIGRWRQTMMILDVSVSRLHAEVALEQGGWRVRDLQSSNGTFVDDVRVAQDLPLRGQAKLRLGLVGFYFLEDATRLPPPRPRRAISQTRAPSAPGAMTTTLEIAAERSRIVTFEFHEASGGGGLIVVDHTSVQVTSPQLELVRLLVHRMLADADVDRDVAGFVAAADLMRLSLDSRNPGFEHVRQLVRRVRRLFAKANLGDLVESRHGFGYRLAVIPVLVEPKRGDG